MLSKVFMLSRPFLILFFLCVVRNISLSQNAQDTLHVPHDSIRISFASCNDQNKKQVLWDDILDNNPHLFVWMGDNIYADTDDMQQLAQEYAKQNNEVQYQKLKQSTPINGTWDDHDYGLNDGGKEFSKRRESQEQFFDFIGLPKEHARRQHDGVYGSQLIESENTEIKIYYLDTRFFRDALLGARPRYAPNYSGTILGEAQWVWLEEQVATSTADINIFVSSIQVIPYEHGWEKWANFPNDRIRLLNLISQNHVKNPIILSGDRHVGEISTMHWNGKELIEVTSSALTNFITPRDEPNQYRIKQGGLNGLYFPINYGLLTISEDNVVHFQLLTDNNQELISIERPLE